MRFTNGGILVGAVAAVFVLVFSSRAHPSAQTDKVAPVAVVPFRETGGTIYIKGAIDGLPDLSIVVDSGSPDFVLSEKLYERLGLPFVGMANMPSPVQGLMPTPIVRTSVPSVSFGTAKIKDVQALVLRLDFIKANTGVETDAIIGSDLFSRYVVELDYSNDLLRLYDPSKYPEPRTGCNLPLNVHNRLRVHAAILTRDGKSIDAVLLLDTGSSYSLFTKPFVASHPNIRAQSASSKPLEGLGESGVVRGRLARAFGIQLGGCTIRDPLAVFSNMTGMYPGVGPVDGEIGLNIFRQFTTIFNYRGGYVVFQPRTTQGLGQTKHAQSRSTQP